MKKIINWTARRAGGRITINGMDAETRELVKVVGVDQIEAGMNGAGPVATDKNGTLYTLG